MTQPHIVFWSRLSFARDLVIECFGAEPGIRFTLAPTLAACIDALPDAQGLVLYNCRPEDARTLMDAVRASAPKLRWMHFLTAGKEGFDAVGIPAHITVTRTDGASAPVVAEHAMALLLALGRRLPQALAQQAAGQWDRGLAMRAASLEGKTMAIVGYGHIGREIARRAHAFGMQVVALSRSGAADEPADEGQPLAALHAVLARSDVVALAIALTPQTHHLIDAAALACCRPGTLLVNVSRGAVIDPAALREALATGQLGGAGLDVTEPEPLPPEDPLWQAPNLIISPHIAVEGSPPTERRLADGAVAEMRRFKAVCAASSLTPLDHSTAPSA
jgi:phosphoglycerate dehydrogenase-like enzyme